MLLRTKEYTKRPRDFSKARRRIKPLGDYEMQGAVHAMATSIARNWLAETMLRSKLDVNSLRFERLDESEETEVSSGYSRQRQVTLRRGYALLPFESQRSEFELDRLPTIRVSIVCPQYYYGDMVFNVEEHWPERKALILSDGLKLKPPTAVQTMPFLLQTTREFTDGYKPKVPLCPPVATSQQVAGRGSRVRTPDIPTTTNAYLEDLLAQLTSLSSGS